MIKIKQLAIIMILSINCYSQDIVSIDPYPCLVDTMYGHYGVDTSSYKFMTITIQDLIDYRSVCIDSIIVYEFLCHSSKKKSRKEWKELPLSCKDCKLTGNYAYITYRRGLTLEGFIEYIKKKKVWIYSPHTVTEN